VSIRDWLSTLKDDPSPDKESMNQVAMATVIGLVAGLAISALIVVSHDLMPVGRVDFPRVLFGSAVAALLATTAFGRGRTHFAKKALYDFPLLALDIVMIIAAAALVGLMTRESFSFDGWAWGWLAVILACQLVRNFRLGSKKVTGLRLGILCLILGLTANIAILLFAPADDRVAAVASVAALILITVQFWREVIIPFR
jgi:alkylation response protein AidB-like acyl-CoA dehydrogenase